MKKKILCSFWAIVAVLLIFAMPITEVEGSSYIEYPAPSVEESNSNIDTSVLFNATTSANRLSIEQLRAKFPDGKHWNHKVTAVSNNGDNLVANRDESFADTVTSYPCATHSGPASVGQYDCNYFDGGIQCFGFAYKLGYDYTGGIRPSTWSVQYSLDNLSVGDIIRYNGHSVFVIAVNNYGGISLAEANYGYDCSIKWDRYITKSQITNFEWVRKCPVSPHTHSYTSTGYESTHPHKEYKKCSCGAIQYTGNTKYLSGYSCCKISGLSLSVPQNEYQFNEDVVFTVSGKNTLKNTIYLYREGVHVRWAGTEKNKFIFYDLEPGNYTAKVTSNNGAYSATSSTISFTVKPEVCTKLVNNTITVSDLAFPSIYRIKGAAYKCAGTIKSNSDIEYILMDVKNASGNLATGYSVYPAAGTKTYNLANFTSKLHFEDLPAGEYTYLIRVKNSSGVAELVKHRFLVVNSLDAKIPTPTLTLDKNTMQAGEVVTATWNKVDGATSYLVNVIQAPWGWSGIVDNGLTRDNQYRFCIDKPGEYKIFVVARDGNNNYISAQSKWQVINVTSTVSVTGVSLNKTSLALEVGNSETLTATVTPSNATNKDVSWNSSDSSVATVENGRVTAKKAGSTVITVTTSDGNKTASCNVTVTEKEPETIPVTGVSLNKTSLALEAGNSETLTATVTPSNATNQAVTWNSSDSSVATVENGRVTAKKAGSTVITVTTSDGNKTASCNVTVTEASSDPQTPPTEIKFQDVPDNAWFAPFVYDLANQGILDGRSDDIFDPDGNITRGEFAKILAFASQDDLSQYEGTSKFTDSRGHWSETNINWAYQNGIVKGQSETSFAPNAKITRQEMAVMIKRYADYKGIELPQTNEAITFADDGKIASWAKVEVTAMQQAGIISGRPGNLFDPEGNATRGEAAKMISILLDL